MEPQITTLQGREAHTLVMDKICDICGAIGFKEAIITCCQCKSAHEHQYCMQGYQEEAPKDWCCEECSLINEKTAISREQKIDCSKGSTHCTVQSKNISEFLGDSRRSINWEKKVQTGKTRYLPVNEALMLSSGFKKGGSSLKISCTSHPVSPKTMAVVPEGNFSKSTVRIPKFCHQAFTQHSVGGSGDLKRQSLGNVPITELAQKPLKSSQDERPAQAYTKGQIENKQTIEALEPIPAIKITPVRDENNRNGTTGASPPSTCRPPSISSGYNGSTKMELRSPDAVDASRMRLPPKAETHPCDPALVSSWEGSFDFLGDLKPGKLNDRIQAHPPSRVKRKVYEFSKLLPDNLQFELVPRGDLWMTIFHSQRPGREDVGLYFFPSERQRSEKYLSLVEFLGVKDLVMRKRINDIELLVLASTALCSDCQRWNGEYFLWGLFRCIRKDEIGSSEGSCSEVVDMEIDMIGGVDICRDVVVNMIVSSNACGSSLKEAVTSVMCDRSESVTPVSRALKSGNELPREDVKREPIDDIPPGFILRWTAIKGSASAGR